MSSNCRITHSKGPSDGTSLPPYTRPKKDTSTKADNAGSPQPLTQQQTACDQLNSTVSHSPFARPGSRAGASTAPATPIGMPPASTSPFAQPGSHTGSARSEVDFPNTAPQAARTLNCIFTHCIYINKILNDPCKTWVKISKVMPQPKSIYPGKGREALRQKVQIFRLKYGMA